MIDDKDMSWFSPQWFKSTALQIALQYVEKNGSNEKLINQLLALAVYQKPSVQQLSENLLNTSLLYYTLY